MPDLPGLRAVGGATLDSQVRANQAQVRYHTMSFLDASSNGNRYSSRAANAALCASDVSVDTFVAYHNILYGKDAGKQVQPAEGTNGRVGHATHRVRAGRPGSPATPLTTFSVVRDVRDSTRRWCGDHREGERATASPARRRST